MKITTRFITGLAALILLTPAAEAAASKKKSAAAPNVVIENWVLSRTRKPPVVKTTFNLANHDRYKFENAAVQIVFLDRLGGPIQAPKRPKPVGLMGPGGEREITLSTINMPVFAGINVIVTGTFKKNKITMRFFASSPYSVPVLLSETPSGNTPRLFLMGQRFKQQGKSDVGNLSLRILNNGLVDAERVSVVVKFYNDKGSLLRAMEEPIDLAAATVPSGEEKSFKVFIRRVPTYKRISVALKYKGAPSEKSLSGEAFSGEPILEIGEVHLKRLDRDNPKRLTLQGKVRNGTEDFVENVKVDWNFTFLEGKVAFVEKAAKSKPGKNSGGTKKDDRLKGVRYLLRKQKVKKEKPGEKTEPVFEFKNKDVSFTIPGDPLKPGEVRRFSMEVPDIFEIQMFEYSLSYGTSTDGGGEATSTQTGEFTIDGLDDFTAGAVTVSGLKLVRKADGAVTLSVKVANKGGKTLKNLVYAVDCLGGTENNPIKVHTLLVKIPVLKAGTTATGTVEATGVPAFESISYSIKWGK